MNPLNKYFYEVNFREIIREQTGTAFENFFAEVMINKYLENFMSCKPWGSDGDRKNDGYLINERNLFAVNGPSSFNQNRMLEKIDSDFSGALPYWEEYYDKWSFVTNQESLPPKIVEKMLSLNSKNVAVNHWGPSVLKDIIFSMPEEKISSLIGPVPTNEDFTNITYETIQPVIRAIKRRSLPKDGDLTPVPANKLFINGFSDSVISIIKMGLTRASLVTDYFNAITDANLADEISEELGKKYVYFRDQKGLDPDEIFEELYSFISEDNQRNTTSDRVARYTVLAYYFEQCAIFERV